MAAGRVMAGIVAWAAVAEGAGAASLPVPNGSFESPTPPPGFPAFPLVDVWQKAPEPAGIPLPGGITWDQLAGVFPNTPAGSADHIDNVDGQQAAYLFAIPGVALFQKLDSRFEVGNAYDLTLGVLGTGGIAEGSTLQLSLYYTDDAQLPVTVASATVTYTAAGFPTATHLVDQTVSLPAVLAGDAWAGREIGVQILSTFGTGVGYWDVDNARVSAVPEPGAAGLLVVGAAGLWWLGRRRNSVA